MSAAISNLWVKKVTHLSLRLLLRWSRVQLSVQSGWERQSSSLSGLFLPGNKGHVQRSPFNLWGDWKASRETHERKSDASQEGKREVVKVSDHKILNLGTTQPLNGSNIQAAFFFSLPVLQHQPETGPVVRSGDQLRPLEGAAVPG